MVEMRPQINYIRACFCIDRALNPVDLRQLMLSLERHQCHTIGPPITESGELLQQSMTWQTARGNWAARLIQLSSDPLTSVLVSFDVDSGLFLPGDAISYNPLEDPDFAAYKRLLIDFIQEIRPLVGIADYDADLLCKDLRSNSFAAWGNYLSNEILIGWDPHELEQIPAMVDEYIRIENRGMLTFNHPLGSGKVFENQVRFWNMVKSQITRNL